MKISKILSNSYKISILANILKLGIHVHIILSSLYKISHNYSLRIIIIMN
jgi:hypothetical protein